MAKSNVAKNTQTASVSTGVFVKILLLALASFLISGLVTWIVDLSLNGLPSIKAAIGGQDSYFQVLFLVYIIFFVISISASSYAFISKEEMTGQVEVQKFKEQESELWQQALAPAKLTPEQEAALRRQKARSALEKSEEIDDLNDVLAASGQGDSETDPQTSESVKLSVKAEKHKVTVMNFLSRGLEGVMTSRPRLDVFNKFGVNLYIAGACDALGTAEGLSEEEIAQIMAESVGVIGTKAEQARKFAGSYGDYLTNPKYLSMIESGRSAISAQMAGDGEAASQLEKALDGWNVKKAEDETSSGTIAVMFTDIVGSTAMTQTHGDAAAQEVVRTHNRIVRAALTTHSGREVKHTGDGIMASFANTANSVEAAIYIQRKVKESNATGPKVPLGLKIGINAGEPIVEDDDLFGTTVQLSARIVDKATNYQILVSETVRGICQGKAIEFTSRGAREMKGFADPITLFEAKWQDDEA